MLLRLQKFNLEVRYKKGTEMFIADTLSRAPLPEVGPPGNCLRPEKEDVCRVDVEQINASEFVRVSDDGLRSIQRETEADAKLQCLKEIVLRGWPETKPEADPRVAEYWTFRDEISIYNGVLYKGDRVIVPTVLRKKLLSRIHASHQGEQACLRRARDALFWPGMSQQVKDLVSSCSLCADFAPAQAKEPLMTPELPKRPWSVIAQDLYSLGGKDFLITVDAYSGFWEVDELPQTTATDVINKTKQHLARYGIPDRVYSDNGPQFDCAEYASFADDWQFEHISSSPYHKQSNGLVEAAVKSAKTLQKKAQRTGRDMWMSFLDYRNTPTEGMDSSPVQRLMSKRAKTTLPLAEHLLEPEIQQDVQTRLTLKRRKAKKHFDPGSKELPDLKIGQPIRMTSLPKDGRNKWRRGICLGKVAPRSYLVDVDGSVFRRNRKFLCSARDSTAEAPPETSPLAVPPDIQSDLVPVQPLQQPTTTEEPPVPVSLTTPEIAQPVKITRSGRISKPPVRLNL
jgi:hypothetical protein